RRARLTSRTLEADRLCRGIAVHAVRHEDARVGPQRIAADRDHQVLRTRNDGYESIGVVRLPEDGGQRAAADQIDEAGMARHDVRPFAHVALYLTGGEARPAEELTLDLGLRESRPGEPLGEDGGQDEKGPE